MRGLGVGAALVLSLVVAGAAPAQVTQVTTRSGLGPAAETVVWPGAVGSHPSDPFTVTSPTGNLLTVSTAPSLEQFTVWEQVPLGVVGPWAGNFTPGDKVLKADQGLPVSIEFSQPVGCVGSQMEAPAFAPFQGTLTAYAGATLLGSVTATGRSSGDCDGSALFLGLQATGEVITRVEFSSVQPDDYRFALNQLSFGPVPPPMAVPDAGTAGLALLALLPLVGIRRHGRRQP